METSQIRRLLTVMLVSLLAMVILAGCVTAEGEMTLYRRGSWEGEFDFTQYRKTCYVT